MANISKYNVHTTITCACNILRHEHAHVREVKFRGGGWVLWKTILYMYLTCKIHNIVSNTVTAQKCSK